MQLLELESLLLLFFFEARVAAFAFCFEELVDIDKSIISVDEISVVGVSNDESKPLSDDVLAFVIDVTTVDECSC